MFIVGLTGSIGMGKSTASGMLREMGFPVFDADQSVKDLLNNDTVIQIIRKKFPSAVQDGRTVDKKELRQLVFMNHERLDTLEGILHPYVKQDREAFIRQKKLEGHELIFLDIPLLFEVKVDKEVDATLVIIAPRFIQKRRVLRRENITKAYWNFIQKRQIADKIKCQKADFVVYCCFGFSMMRLKLRQVINKIKMHYINNGKGNP